MLFCQIFTTKIITMSKLFIKDRFATTPNALLYNSNISLRAKGLFAYIQGKPDKWSFSAERIAFENKEGVQSVRSALQELEKFGYLQRLKTKNDKGHWEIDYILYCEPQNPADENPTSEFRPSEIHMTENPTSGNHTNNIKKDIRKKDINKKSNTKIDISFFDDGWFDIWEEWLQFKKNIKKSYKTDISEMAAFNKLKLLSENNQDKARKIIQQSIENDWVGFFELKEEKNNKSGILNFD